MKKLTILLVIIFTFLFSTTSWGEWSYVTETLNGNKFYYDKDRVRKSGKYIYFWELVDLLKPLHGDLSVITYIELDCSILRYKSLKIQGYKNSMGEGENTMDFTPKDEWRYPQPKSSTEVLYNKICEEHQKNYVSLDVKKREVIYWGKRDGKYSFYREKWEGLETEENIDYKKYEGDTVKGIPNGQGTYTWSSGKKYVGEFKDGFPNGQGTETFPNGRMYVGEWKEGEKNGQGTLTYSYGRKFVGEWKDGKPWNGTSYRKDGNIGYKIVYGEIQ